MNVVFRIRQLTAAITIACTYPSEVKASPRPCQLDILEDDTAQMTVHMAMTQRSDAWTNFSDSSRSFGFSKSAYWLRFRCQTNTVERSIVKLSYPNLTEVNVFQTDGERLINTSIGASSDFRMHPVFYRMPVFDLSTFDTTRDIFVRIASQGSLQFPVTYLSASEFRDALTLEYLLFGVYYGMLLAIALYNGFLYVSSREIVFAQYTLYALAFGLFQMSMNGLAQQFLWPAPSWWSHNAVSIEIPFFLVLMIQFAKTYLGRPSMPRGHWLTLTLAQAVCGIIVVGIAFLTYKVINQINAIMCFVSVSLLLVAGGFGIRARRPAANYYTLAWFLFLVGLGLFALRNLGILPSNFATTYAIQIGSASELMLLSLGLGARLRFLREANAKSEAHLAEIRIRSAAAEGIAQTTQMLAHDVRRPFSVLRMGLGMLRTAKDKESLNSVLLRLLPEVDKAMRSVEGLIADVMEVGSNSNDLIQEGVSPESLIESAVSDVFRIYPKAKVALSYDMTHIHKVNVNAQKVGRVFANIVGNAVQAMHCGGELWFRTEEHADVVKFCVGNSGSFIPAQQLPRLFDAFFTSGKKGGTGLGLAIAQKVVSAHGGRIWCESEQNEVHPIGKVEFFFTLPVAEGQLNQSVAYLPKHSSEVAESLQASTGPESGVTIDKDERTLEAELVKRGMNLAQPLQVLVVDDEAVYRDAIVAYLSRTDELKNSIQVRTAAGIGGDDEFMQAQVFDLIITDVDMGPNSANGFELVRDLRKKGIESLICIHSNRIVAADHKKAYEAGADVFLPKPMARAQLLRLLLQAVANAGSSSPSKSTDLRSSCQISDLENLKFLS